MTIIVKFVVLSFVILLAWVSEVAAQAAPPKKGAPPAPAVQATPAPTASATQQGEQNAPPPPGWVARCGSTSREAPLECGIEEGVFTKAGQLVVLVSIRVAADTHTPTGAVQLPLGLNIPAGAKVQVDDGKVVDAQIQTCENRGCYANLPIAADMLAAMRTGKQLKVSFQNLGKESLTIPMPLTDFAAAYDKIK